MVRSDLIKSIMVSLIFLSPAMVYAQSTAPAAPAPEIIDTPPDFPEYMVTPRDDLNPYDYSTMEKTTETDYREGAGTLGTTEDRRSNIEVNEALKRNKAEREAAKQKSKKKPDSESDKPDNNDLSAAPRPEELDTGDKILSPRVRGGLFTWTDEDGVLHATNDLGQVPIEYQVQALENSKNIKVNKAGSTNKK